MVVTTLTDQLGAAVGEHVAGAELSDLSVRAMLPEHIGHRYQALMADIDIAERRMPKDGRISLSVDGAVVDLRVSTLPTVYGAKVVVRILDRASSAQTLESVTVEYHAVGCPNCGGTGYKGRTAIHEVMLMSEELDRLVVASASSEELRRVATEQAMMDLRSDGLAKVALGTTTLAEVARVVA